MLRSVLSIASLLAVVSASFTGVDTNALPPAGTTTTASTATTIASTPSSIVDLSYTPENKPCRRRLIPSGGNSTTVTCNADRMYAAVLFEQNYYSGVKHWIDGSDNSCRGLNGTSVFSVRHVASVGGDPVRNRCSTEYAAGVTLEFYENWNCGGRMVASVDGNAADVQLTGPLSVKIRCNGQGYGDNTPLPVPETATVQLFEDKNYGGISHQTDAPLGECRGLSGVPVASMKYLVAANGTDCLSDEKANDYTTVYFSDYGCQGSKLGEVRGNSPVTEGNGLCDAKGYPKSMMIVPTDAQQRAMSSDASSTAASFGALAVAAIAALF